MAQQLGDLGAKFGRSLQEGWETFGQELGDALGKQRRSVTDTRVMLVHPLCRVKLMRSLVDI